MKSSWEILEFCADKLRAHRADLFEICWEKSSSLGVEINDGKLDHLSRSTDQGLAIRVLKEGRMGFSYTFDLSPKAAEIAVRTALEIAALMPQDPLGGLTAFAPARLQKIEAWDERGLQVPLEEKIALARETESNAKRHDSRIKRVRKAGFDEISAETAMLDSAGTLIRHRATYFAADLSCVAEDGASAEMGHDSQYAIAYEKLLPGEIAKQAAMSALELLHASQAPTMACPAVFKNSVVAQLVGFLASSFSAENVDKNFSLLAGKRGVELFSKKLTLLDDGLLKDGVATAPFDGEGFPAQTTTLIEDGVVSSYLYDSYYARKHETKSTSNSRRGSLKAAPSIGPTNLYLAKGKVPLKELVASIPKGIFITEVMGLHTANPITGEFSIGASGILIERGALTRPVKGFAIAGNLIDLLKNVSEVGSDLKFWGSIGAPSLMVSKLSVGGS